MAHPVGPNQPQQHALTQASISYDDTRGGPQPGNSGKNRAARQHELNTLRSNAWMLHQAAAAQGAQRSKRAACLVCRKFHAVHSRTPVPLQVQRHTGERCDSAACAKKADTAIADLAADAVHALEW